MANSTLFGVRGLAAAALVTLSASAASAQWNPIAFGPLGGLSGGAYWTSVADISGDGLSFVGGTSFGQVLLRTPGGDYSLTGSSPFGMSRDGQTVVGGTSGAVPQRWNLANAVGNTIASQNITWPGGPTATGPAYGTNANGTHFALPTPTSVITPSGIQGANAAFIAMNPLASAGAYRGIAANAPVMVVLGTFPGNPTNAYRWNYGAGTASPLNMPAGASSIDAGGVGASISGDASRVGGSATIGGISQPYWWDAAGTPHAVPALPGGLFGSLAAMNYTGTLGGGSMWISGQGNRAMLHALDGGQVYNLNDVYTTAGLLPAGWTLISTRHISDDGTRIFCLATAPDGSNRFVQLTGSFVPTPGSASLLGAAGLAATRRRRR